ncbi:dymeclin isoform X2 [Toxorhynchites rutilus septentrionalis]|uniref:dymeclin isoform X2 n=1 Tax=Toxorhynchites rutilus septentrionalis TaxID=329112 RepID=UPI002479D639|nr:dymeclin isoform X2 [Toxorhynchites rutilus septentrionalis]
MGMNVSRQADLAENEYLKRFVGKEHIPAYNDEFWNSFLQYHINLPTNSQEQLSLDSRLESLCQSFISHNLSTGNFGSLISVYLIKVSELLALSDAESTVHIWHAFNALFIIRSLVKYMIETGSEYQLLQHFEAIPLPQNHHEEHAGNSGVVALNIDPKAGAETRAAVAKLIDGTKFETFLEALVNIIVVIPVKEFTYHLHLEAVNCLIVLLSISQFSQQGTDKSTIFRTIYKCQHANTLMGALLHFLSRMTQVPSTMFGFGSGGSFVFGIAESLWSILTFSRKQPDILSTHDLPTAFKDYYPLANQSLLLILILTNHCTTKENPYRVSLFGCSDSQESPKEDVATFKIEFSSLYNTLCRIVTIDQATLLLYLLLHRNQKFYKYVMAQQNLQQLVIPILQTLYNAPDSTSHHIYMSLIVLLILSEDDNFNKSVHQIILKNITWYTERSISEISLGGLLILVVIRTIQYNMLKMRDKYLHTNCLAALANMSGQFRSLHPYVAQRLVSLFETLAKKHARLDQQLKQTVNGNASNVTVPIAVPSSEDMDLSVLEEVLRMVLEILNSCLSHQLVYCPNLVYTLLYKRNVFEAFRSHSAFQDIIQNIDMVVGFFSSRLVRVQDQRGELGVNEVLEVISKGASQWSSDRLRKFPDLKFKYVEEDAPEEFFIPYVWTLVCKAGCVHFSSESIKGVTTEISC